MGVCGLGCSLGMVWCAQDEPGHDRVSYPQEVEGWSEVSTLFVHCGSDPWYKLPAATLRRLSHPVSQTGPSVIVGLIVPAQQKK